VSEGVLQQAEVDRLVGELRQGRGETRPGSLLPLLRTQPLDVRDPGWSADRIIRRRLPVLDLVLDRLGPSLQVTLTKNLRFPVRTENAGLELIKFGDFRARFDDQPCLFEVMRLDPLRGLSVMLLAPPIVYALVDALTGGLGVGELPRERAVSDIEESLIHKAHMDLLRDLESAWKPWFPLRVEHVRCDRAVQVMSTISDEEVCHVGTINVAGDVLSPSPIFFVLPYISMEPLLEATSSRVGDESDPNWRANLVQNLRDSRARVSAILGETMLPARRVRELAPGDMIELGRRIDEEIDVQVEGRDVFKARIGQSHQCYAVRVASKREPVGALQDRSSGQILVRKGLITREQLAVAQVDERMNRRELLDSIASRGWVERRVLEHALQS